MCCIFILIILRPLKINSGFHFKKIALLKMNWESKALALWAIATTLLHQGQCCKDKIINPRPGNQRMNGASYQSGLSPFLYLPDFRKNYKNAEHTQESKRAPSHSPRTSYPAWFQNRRTRTKHHRCGAIRSLMAE
jgi:hypothetical protein